MALELGYGPNTLNIDAFGAARVRLVDESGAAIGKAAGELRGAGDDALPMMGVNDGSYRHIRVDRMGNQGISYQTPLFDGIFDGATVNAAQFSLAAAVQTGVQATGTGMGLNAGASVAINGSAVLQTLRKFTFRSRGPMIKRVRARLVKGGTNGVAEIGFGDVATNVALATGAMWQYTAAGALVPVVAYNGTQLTGLDVAALIDPLKYYWWDIIVSDDSITFTIQNPLNGVILSEQTLMIGPDAGRMFSASRLGSFERTYVGGAIATAPATQLFIGQSYVGAYDTNLNKNVAQVMAGMGLALDVNPATGVQTANQTNSTAPVSATLSNTAAGYATLGGKFQFAAVAGAETDYALFAYQVPAGYQANITGITIEAENLGAIVATTGTSLEWDIARGATAVSLATAGTIKRGGLGKQNFPVGAAIGAVANRIAEKFSTPFVVESGRFLHVILRMPVGTATASQIIRGQVAIEGYWGE